MLSWITGSRAAVEEGRKDVDPVEPETPGPVFAFRAFKHALLGTPRPAPPTQSHGSTLTPTSTSASATTSSSIHFVRNSPGKIKSDRRFSADMSTSTPHNRSSSSVVVKHPHGILLTPGPGTAQRRKTVSFGSLVEENDGDKKTAPASRIGGSSNPNGITPNRIVRNIVPGAFPVSPFVETPAAMLAETLGIGEKQMSNPPMPIKQRTRLTETLYSVREDREDGSKTSIVSSSNKQIQSSVVNPNTRDDHHNVRTREISSTATSTTPTTSNDQDQHSYDSDSTVDLEQPKSQSGQFWKQHFESYSERSERELRGILLELRTARQQAEDRDMQLATIRNTSMVDRSEAKAREGELSRRVDLYKSRLDETLDEVKRLRSQLQAVTTGTAAASTAPSKYPAPLKSQNGNQTKVEDIIESKSIIAKSPFEYSPPRSTSRPPLNYSPTGPLSRPSLRPPSRPPSSFTQSGSRSHRNGRTPRPILDSPPRESRALLSSENMTTTSPQSDIKRTGGLSFRERSEHMTTESFDRNMKSNLNTNSVPSLRPSSARLPLSSISTDDLPTTRKGISLPSSIREEDLVHATVEPSDDPSLSSKPFDPAAGGRKVWPDRAAKVRAELQRLRSQKGQTRSKVEAV